MKDIEAELVAAIRDRYHREVQADTALASLGVDSMQMTDLAADVERRFGIEVDQDVFDAETVAQLAAYIRSRQAG